MIDALRFVQGAVAKKDLLPAMTHFKIHNGTVRAFNGSLAICCPIPFDIDCIPKAEPLIKAINNCNETTVLSMTPTGRLRIQSGQFRAFIECINDETPRIEPAGKEIQLDGEKLIKAFETLLPFVGSDASRPWCNGILLRGQSAFATNNVCLVEYWFGTDVPFVVNIPLAAIKELIRIKEMPIHCQLDETSITFHYEGDRWIRSQLFNSEWPDLTQVLDHKCNAEPIDPLLFEGLTNIAPFADDLGRVYIREGQLRTHFEGEVGASFEISNQLIEGLYQIKMLALLEDVATSIDFSRYPLPTLFFGEFLRGAIIGMRMHVG